MNGVRDGDEEDEGVSDKRLLAVEEEFARLLAVASRDGSTLSPILRQAWDSGNLRVLTRKEPLRATGAHISVLAHTTIEELRRRLPDIEIANEFANRFLFILARRSKVLPSGGNLDPREIERLGRLCRAALEEGRRAGRLSRSAAAEARWDALYREMADEDDGGLLGTVTARAEAQVLRLSVAYALTDGSTLIDVPHLEAAWALWRYAAASARYIFGDALGDPVADRLLEALRGTGEAGLDFSAQRDVFGRHVPAARLAAARANLERLGLIVTRSEETGGRPRTRSYALARKAPLAREGPDARGFRAFSAHRAEGEGA